MIKTENTNNTEGDMEGLLATVTRMTKESKQSQRAMGGVMMDTVAAWVTPRYLVALRGELASGADEHERFQMLRKAAGDVVLLQRGGVWTGRLELDREKFKFQQKRHKELMAAGNEAKVKKRDLNEPMTEAELKACVDKVDEIMGLK